MRNTCLALLAASSFFVLSSRAAPDAPSRPLWHRASEDAAAGVRSSAGRAGATRKARLQPVAGGVVTLDHAELGRRLAPVLPEGLGSWDETGTEIELPLPDGTTQRFLLLESPVMSPALAAKFPDIRTFALRGLDDPAASGRADLTPAGFRALVLSPAGQFFVDPAYVGDADTHVSYFRRDYFDAAKSRLGCLFDRAQRTADDARRAAAIAQAFPAGSRSAPVAPTVAPAGVATETDAAVVADGEVAARPTGANLRTYRLAVAATAEYTAAVSGTNPGTVSQALAAIVTTVNRVSALYERDVAVRLQLVANEEALVFTNSASDGYTDNSPTSLLSENQTKIDAVIGAANYDIGHVFSTGGGGIAGLGVVCLAGQKARGVTGSPAPYGDPYDIDYVAHEMGHQFGGNHTFNGTTGSCSGTNRNASTAYEPGSGVTIMAYAGICSPQDLAPNSDDYFHTASYDEIDAFVTSTGACPTSTATGNTAPVPVAPAAATIPANTPFALTASATDVNGDTLTYCWEEFDKGAAQDPTAAPRDNGASPIFRSFAPTLSPTRLFPSLPFILANANVPPATVATYATGEILPDTNRTMTFRVTVRDNRAGGGGSNWASTTVTSVKTSGANTFGPFRLSSQNAAATLTAGTPFTVTWDVANTTLAPVSCANVKLSLSTDGGRTFPYVLVASTPNNGSVSATIPDLGQYATAQARLKLEAVGNIFFDVNDADLAVTTSHPAPTFNVTGSLTVRRGTPTATVAVVGTAASASASTPYTVTVQGAPFGAAVTGSVDGLGQVSLSATAACAVTTTNSTRTYPLTVVVADSLGSTVAKTVNLVVQPNLAPTLGTYAATIVAPASSAVIAPSAALADGNGNLGAAPFTVQPATLPGGGTIAVNQATGAVTVTTTAGSTLGATTVRVTAVDSCGAAVVRYLTVTVQPVGPAFVAGTVGAPSAESAVPANGFIEPGETVTLALPIQNIGTAATTNLVGTLQATGGVQLPGGPVVFGAVAAGATASQPFTFRASGTCGGTITATLALQDGAASYGPLTYTLRLGVPTAGVVQWAQNFDGVTAPALPAGWTSAVPQGAATGWTTAAATPHTSPNSVFATPTASTSEQILETPAFALSATAASPRLSFQHRWRTEANYDGGVLEVSVDAGAYQDVVAAGGTFEAGAYNDTSGGGPIAGRAMWGGNQNSSYTLTTVALPDSLAGHSLRFRWRLGCDESVSVSQHVWRIDTVQFTATTYSCGTAPSITSALPAGPLVVGQPYTHTFVATGAPAPVFALSAGTLPAGLTVSAGGVLAGTPTNAGTGTFGGLAVTASNGLAPSSTQNFSLAVVTRLANYVAGFGLGGANALPLADPDGDGLGNAVEYALGLNPAVANASPVLVEIRNYAGTDYLALVYARKSVATDVAYVVEGTGDLAAGVWTELSRSTAGAAATGVGFVGETGSAPTFVVETRDTVATGAAVPPRRFLRLRIELLP